jgi:hypothetical protein
MCGTLEVAGILTDQLSWKQKADRIALYGIFSVGRQGHPVPDVYEKCPYSRHINNATEVYSAYYIKVNVTFAL